MNRARSILLPTGALSILAIQVNGADLQAHYVQNDVLIPRVVAQVMGGTSGFEPGLAAEWRINDESVIVRPEILLSVDGNVGVGASGLWALTFLDLPEHQAIAIGPRVVYHNSDDSGWEADAQVIYSFDFYSSPRGRYYLEVIGAVGILEDKGGDDGAEIGASIGVGYGYQF